MAMIGTVLLATTVAVLIVILISALQDTNHLASLTWISFTAFPLIIVVMIASLARLQQRINVRSPQSAENDGAERP